MSKHMKQIDIAVIGGGAAGLAAATAAYDSGVSNVVVFDREEAPGGILKQCIHNGFGLHRFKEELTGPEYAAREFAALTQRGIAYVPEATVFQMESVSEGTRLSVLSPINGFEQVLAHAVVLAMGSRERTRGALRIPGTRPAGIYTAGAAQHLINLQGIMPGKEVVMLGSGDIGLIVARRLAYEGAHVKAVFNRSHISSGLRRNIVQCLDDYGIPLKLLHTVTSIYGSRRLEAVGVSEVDKATKRAIPGTEQIIPCDTLLLAVGLIPENDLARQAGVTLDPKSHGALVDERYQTSLPGVFSCGNVLHIHDLVDFVSEEGEAAGRAAAAYLGAPSSDAPAAPAADTTEVLPGAGVSYVVPQRLSAQPNGKIPLRFRVRDVYRDLTICVSADGREVKRFRRAVAVPAEMQTVRLDGALLAGARTVEVSVNAQHEPAVQHDAPSKQPASCAKDQEVR